MKIAFSVPETIFGAASSHTTWLRGWRETESGSMSPKTMISWPLKSFRMKNAELSTGWKWVLASVISAWAPGVLGKPG